jgi:hypothetical protein
MTLAIFDKNAPSGLCYANGRGNKFQIEIYKRVNTQSDSRIEK